MLVLTGEIRKELSVHAQAAYPGECCGVLLGKREDEKKIVFQVIRTENKSGADRRNTHFRIGPLEFAEIEQFAEREQLEIIGFYHSHPDFEAVASREDVRYMIPGYSYPILSVRCGEPVRIMCFEKSTQETSKVNEEIITIQGESPNADPGICISDLANLYKSKSQG